MKYYQKYQQFSDSKFRRMLGVNKDQFEKIYQLFKDYVEVNWTNRGRPSEFSLVDRLILSFRYLRDYPTFVVLGDEFGISESFANKIFNRVSKSLVKVVPLPNLKELESDFEQRSKVIQKVIIDVSEQKTERPKKKQKVKYSGKQKCHTDKAMISYSTDLNQILSVSTAVGSTHDFKIFKQSNIWTYKVIQKAKEKQFDLGFLGVKTYIKDAQLPHKQSKLHKLTNDQKQENKTLSQSRIKIENINREIKIFRICKETRRHKQKKHNLFWTIICGIVNFKLLN